MPSRFSAAFKRKSATSPDEAQKSTASPNEPSFRVIERQPLPAKNFDGGARMARASGLHTHTYSNSELDVEDNIFAGMNSYRGSGGSNTTKATSTDTSSRHSNASTAPSSADMTHTYEDGRGGKRAPAQDPLRPQSQKASGESFLDRAGRTFSFGMQKKGHASQPKNDVPDVPPLPTLQREDEYGRTRAMTASTTSTATPPRVEDHSGGFDLGDNFGNILNSFDKRSSTATLRNDGTAGQRNAQTGPAHLSFDTTSAVEPSPSSWDSSHSNDKLIVSPNMPSTSDRPPPVPRHQPSFEYRSSTSPTGVVEDEDARLLADSVAATRFLSDKRSNQPQVRHSWRNEDTFAELPRRSTLDSQPEKENEHEENMFAGTTAGFSRPTLRAAVQVDSPHRGSKVMTNAEFERLQKEKERQRLERVVYGGNAEDDDDDEEINYDDDEEDEEEKLKRQAKQSRNKQVQMQAYRQRNMKTTGDLGRTSPSPSSRPSLPNSLSAPQLGIAKTPSPEPVQQAADDDDDEEVPLAILQAHGFPQKNRNSSGRLSAVGSNPNLRSVAQAQNARPASVAGDPAPATSKRSSTLPAFARGLPQDPFVGAGIARPAVRESLAFSGGQQPQQTPQAQPSPMHPGGLVGVIASEERARAMRRGSPNMESQRLGHTGTNFDPLSGIPQHMMYGGGMQPGATGTQRVPQQPAPTPADQAQLQLNQQMTQFMQMQMQFMQLMAGQNGGQNPQQMMPPHMMQQMPGMNMQQMQQQMQQPYNMMAGSQSFADLSGQPGAGQGLAQPRRLDAGSRTMSMVQPSTSAPFNHTGGYAPSINGPGAGYTPSIAPSERSNIGLPGRYRPVSQASGSVAPGLPMHKRTASFADTLSFSRADDNKPKSVAQGTSRAKAGSDDDDEEGWEAMRAKRDQKKSRWRRKKPTDGY